MVHNNELVSFAKLLIQATKLAKSFDGICPYTQPDLCNTMFCKDGNDTMNLLSIAIVRRFLNEHFIMETTPQ